MQLWNSMTATETEEQKPSKRLNLVSLGLRGNLAAGQNLTVLCLENGSFSVRGVGLLPRPKSYPC